MQKTFSLLAILGFMVTPLVHADVLTLPTVQVSDSDLPQRGTRQTEVASRFGEPLQRHAPVGGGTAQQPPITRWDYDGYSVFFENSTVIDVVVKGAPKPLHNVDELQSGP